MDYPVASFPMALTDLVGHSPAASLFKRDYCAAIDKISTDVERRAVPLQQTSFLSNYITKHYSSTP